MPHVGRQVYCNLNTIDIRHSRDTLLIEKCRQVDPEVAGDPQRLTSVGKMFVKMDRVMALRNIHSLEQHEAGTHGRKKSMAWPDLGRMRHYRGMRQRGSLEYPLGTDDSMDRYIEPLRASVLHLPTSSS